MIDKDRYQWVEKIFFNVIPKAARVLKETTIGNLRVGATCRGIVGIKALATRPDGAIVAIVANASTSAVEWTKQVGTRLREPWTGHCYRKQPLAHGERQPLKVKLAVGFKQNER